MSEVRFVTTPTEKREFRTCRRKWWLTIDQKLQRRNAIAWELELGDCVHAGLEVYYTTDRSLTACLSAFGEAWNEADERFQRTYGPLYEHGIQEEWGQWRETGLDMLSYYDVFDRAHPFFDDVVDIVAEERGYVVMRDPETAEELPGRPLLAAKPDLVVTKDGGVWIVDHKTAASPHDSNALDVDDQLTAYCYLYWRQTGIVPEGAIYNRLSKSPPHPPRRLKSDKPGKILSQAKDARTVDTLFLEAARFYDPEGLEAGAYDEYIDFLETKGWDQFYGREQVRRSLNELLEFERRMYNEYLDMQDALEHEGARYPNPSQWNCRKCPVLSICHGMERREDLEYLVEHGYEVKEDRFTIPEGV